MSYTVDRRYHYQVGTSNVSQTVAVNLSQRNSRISTSVVKRSWRHMPNFTVYSLQLNRPIQHLLRRWSHLGVKIKHLSQKLPCNLRHPTSHILQRLVNHLIIQNFLRKSPPWNNTLDKLIKDDSNGPNITTNTIIIILQSLRRHVDRTTNIVIFMITYL